MAINKDELEKLYFDGTKHSRYQNIPMFVQEALGYSVQIDEQWRGDTARYTNLLQNLDFENTKILGDIGANTGFFTLSIGRRYAHIEVQAYEANNNHSRFIQSIVERFGLKNVQVHNLAVDLAGVDKLGYHDCLLNYNVLHHAGVDFDKGLVTIETFFEYAREYLNKLAGKTKYMIFQMGFHWGGDKTKPIVHVTDDAGKVLYMSEIFRESKWKIDKIFTVRQAGAYAYSEMPAEIIHTLNVRSGKELNLLTDYYKRYQLESFSEFYRRPLFYCKSETY